MNIKRLREKVDTGFETQIIETEREKGYPTFNALGLLSSEKT
jgi:DNA-binding response OmpR family regulator